MKMAPTVDGFVHALGLRVGLSKSQRLLEMITFAPLVIMVLEVPVAHLL